jgi:hypothetical protein
MIGWRWWSGAFTNLSVGSIVQTLAMQGLIVTPAQQAALAAVAYGGVVSAALLSGARYQLWNGLEFTLSRELPPAYCWRHPTHRPPVAGCTCGPRVVPKLSDLANYAADSLRQLPPGRVAGRHVFGRVKTFGPTLPGVGHNQDGACCRLAAQFGENCLRADPARTVRAAAAKLVGPLYLSPTFNATEDVDAFTRAFGVKVIPATSGSEFSEWVGQLRGAPYEMPNTAEHLTHLMADLAIATQELLTVLVGDYGTENVVATAAAGAQLSAALHTLLHSPAYRPEREVAPEATLDAVELLPVALNVLSGTPVEAELRDLAEAARPGWAAANR